jgi:hypothetical protein
MAFFTFLDGQQLVRQDRDKRPLPVGDGGGPGIPFFRHSGKEIIGVLLENRKLKRGVGVIISLLFVVIAQSGVKFLLQDSYITRDSPGINRFPICYLIIGGRENGGDLYGVIGTRDRFSRRVMWKEVTFLCRFA